MKSVDTAGSSVAAVKPHDLKWQHILTILFSVDQTSKSKEVHFQILTNLIFLSKITQTMSQKLREIKNLIQQ